jgi:hypothetical protein
MSITPPEVVQAMRSMGWPVAANLMDRWCTSSEWVMPDNVKSGQVDPVSGINNSHVDESIVTMNWLSKYSQPTTMRDDLAKNALNAAGQKQLKKRLADAGWSSGSFSLGHRNMSARELDSKCAVNFRAFGSMLDTINDLYGALGKAALKAAVIGTVETANGKSIFKVAALGIFLRDNYDFNGTQPLGVWSKRRCLSKTESLAYFGSVAAQLTIYRDFTPANNATFRNWRDSTHKGGDFVLYSDVEWIDPPVKEIAL